MAGLIKRGKHYYAVYTAGGKEHRKTLGTTSRQIAKAKLVELEYRLARDEMDHYPTKTPLTTILEAYVEYIRWAKTKSSFKIDTWYLRDMFGPVCASLEKKERHKSAKPRKPRRRKRARPRLEVHCIEDLTTALIAKFISDKVIRTGIAPKTANRYREIISRLISWAVDQRGVRMPGGRNPATKVERYRQPATEIRFLNLGQIAKQFSVLEDAPLFQAMVAVYIYGGLRREEALWLRPEDIALDAGRYGMMRVRAKTINGEHWEPKTKVNRAVPISRVLREYIDIYQNDHPTRGWYFPSPQGTRWDPDNFSHALRRINRRADLPWSCLDYRHTFGSHLAMKGESLYKISTLLGNSPEICRRHYAALIPEALVDTVEFDPATTTSETKPAPSLRVISRDGELVDAPLEPRGRDRNKFSR